MRIPTHRAVRIGLPLTLALGAGTTAAEPFPADVPRLDVADGVQVLEVPQHTFEGVPIGPDGRLLDDFDGDGAPDYAFVVPRLPNESCPGIALVPSSINPSTDYARADLDSLPRIVDPLELDFATDTVVPGCNVNINTLSETGDVDGDGVRDFVVTSLDAGTVILERVVFTRLGGGAVDVTALDGGDGFTLRAAQWRGADSDVDGDGLVDPVIFGGDGERRGLRVLRGRSSWPAEIRYATPTDDEVLVEVDATENFAPTAVEVGDLDADGYDDLLLYTSVTAPGNPSGSGFTRDEGDAALIHGAPDLRVRAPSELELPGDPFIGACTSQPCFFAAAGDVDADGFDDLLASVQERIEPSDDQGLPRFRFADVVLYGGDARLTPKASLDGFDAGRRTRIVRTIGNPVELGGLGDLNGDGATDLFVGSDAVLLGTPGTRPATRALDELDGDDGFTYGTGITTSSLEGLDVNGDGLDDLVFGGRTYLPGRITDPTTPTTPAPAGPVAPDGLRATVYSATALELFWNRSQAFGLSYEVRRGDEVLGTTDGTSFYLDSTDARRAATYSVVAIDRDGQRSSPSTVTVGDGGGGGTLGDAPAAPSGVRATVYSATALELFWDRSQAFGLSYEVRRGDEVIGTTDGTSLFLGSTDARRAATYSVIAIDRDGRRSAASTVSVGGGASGGAPAAPSGVRAAVYSATALELFWNRPSTFGLSYEVRRGDRVVGTTDGTSLFLGSTDARRAATYSVIAIDRNGRRSAASTVAVGG